MSGDLSPATQAFLNEHVEEYEDLEVLLLLFRHPERSWSAAEVAEHLRVSSDAVTDALAHMRSHALAESVPGPIPRFRYAASQGGTCVEELSAAYEHDRLRIIRRMNANALERLRTSAIRAFAEAFRLRKGRDDG
ncbi:MAG TPA: hypothetical protein VFO11_00905 [Candidatus Polarisedimenticolaceae bacterium]|nr:hypothetical protein [Candidatus Polarisedimenticolaceae bacterium]